MENRQTKTQTNIPQDEDASDQEDGADVRGMEVT